MRGKITILTLMTEQNAQIVPEGFVLNDQKNIKRHALKASKNTKFLTLKSKGLQKIKFKQCQSKMKSIKKKKKLIKKYKSNKNRRI